jgi:aprataxin
VCLSLRQAIVYRDDLVTIIKDKYPKARHHYLVLPNSRVPALAALTAQHLALLEHMQKRAAKLIASWVPFSL